MNDWPHLRDREGLVHLAQYAPAVLMRTTVCERVFDTAFLDEDLLITRAPVTCLLCARTKAP